MYTYPDALVELDFLFVVLLCIERIEPNVVVIQLCPNLNGHARERRMQRYGK